MSEELDEKGVTPDQVQEPDSHEADVAQAEVEVKADESTDAASECLDEKIADAVEDAHEDAAAEAEGSDAADDSPAEAAAESRIPPLPKDADTEGASWEKPSSRHYGYLLLFFATMVAIGALSWWAGSPVVCIVIIAVTLAIIIAVFVEGSQFVSKFLAPHREEPEYPSAHSPEERDRAERLGTILVPAKEDAMDTFSAGLDKDERAAVARNRHAEADATYAWIKGEPDFTKVSTTSDDGTQLSGHVLECNPSSKRWVVLVHGFGGEWHEMMLYARKYAQRDFNLLIVEMRAHSTSGGEIIGMGYTDRRDLVAWAQWLVAQKGDDVQIVLGGHSMGGAAVCLADGEDDLPSQVKAVVSDCGYSDMWNVLASVMTSGMHLPVHPLIDVMRFSLQHRKGGYDLIKVSPEQAVAHAHAPLLVIHGDRDTFVPPYMAKRISDACDGAAKGKDHELLMVPHAGHCQSSLVDPDLYYDTVFDFVERYL